ncbi:hypothetical protein D3C80_553070 [compost metagenome]
MADAQDRFGDRSDQSHVIGSLQNALVQGAGLVGFAQHVEGTLVGERLVADGQGEVYRDPAAIDPRVDVVGEGEHQRVTWAKGDGGRAVGVGVTRGQAPDAVEVQAAEVEQWQRQVSGELEVLVVAGYQVIAQAEGDAVTRTQLGARGRGAIAVEVGQVDLYLAGGNARERAGTVALVETAEVKRVEQHGRSGGGIVTERVAFVDFTVRRTSGRPIALADRGLVTDDRQGGTLKQIIEGQVAIEPATAGQFLAHCPGNVEDQRGAAIGSGGPNADRQRDGLSEAVNSDGQGRGATYQGLAVGQAVGDDETAVAKECLAIGEVVRQGDVQGVGERVTGGYSGCTAVNGDGDLFLQGDGFGHEADILPLAIELDLAAGSIARVQRLPVARRGGTVEGDGDVVAGYRVEDWCTGGVVIGHEELHIGAGRGGERRVTDAELADIQVVAQVAVVVERENGLDQGRIAHCTAIVKGDRRQRATTTGGDGGDDDIIGDRLDDHHIGQGLRVGRGNGDVQVSLEVRAGCRFTFRGGDHLIDNNDCRVHHVAVGIGRGFQDAWVGGRVVQRVIAILEAAAGADGQVRGRSGKRKIGVGQIAQRCRYLNRDGRLALADTGKRQFHHHHLITGTHTEVGRIDDQRLAIATDGQRVAGLAIGVERQDMGGQRLPQICGRNKGNAVIYLGAGSVLAGGWKEQVDKGRIAGVAGAVGEGHGKCEGIAQQHLGTAGQLGAWAGSQQPVVTGHGSGRQRRGFVDRAAGHFQGPVAAGAGTAGIVAGGADIGTGPA